jgi:hypothetical protein
MIFYEHAMLGGTLGLAVGVHCRHGWGIVATAAAAALPDWDAVSRLFGAETYSKVHRLWGHNALIAGSTGAACGLLGYLCHISTRVRGHVDRLLRKLEPRRYIGGGVPARFSITALAGWLIVGIVAGLSHLPADIIYGGGSAPAWPVKVFWPFSEREWVYPVFPWGDLGVTILFIGEMFALARWPRFGTLIAWVTLAAVAVYALTQKAFG